MAVLAFLQSIEELLRRTDATEHSYRRALAELFEAELAPAVVINEPGRRAYGAPDLLIEQRGAQLGYVEAKDVGVDLGAIVEDSQRSSPRTDNGKQLKRYRAALPNLLLTDGLTWYWFAAGDPRGEPLTIATWNRAARRLDRSRTAEADLRRLLAQFGSQRPTFAGTPRELAEHLAEHARWLRDAITTIFASEPDGTGALHQQLRAFRDTLLPDLEPPAFADMYAQTIVYGLFAARITAPGASRFTRTDAAMLIPRTNPFLRQMFQQIAGYDLDERIAWIVDTCAALLESAHLENVLQDFGRATRQQDPVVHFYETFLAAYDPRLRETRGVYYTPEPVVSYLVRSVDALLRNRFGKPSGLADRSAIVLDPATGTATFLHTIVQHIYATLQDEGRAGTWDQYVRTDLLPRLFGFELLMAPYTVAHLKIGLLLGELGYRFNTDERLGIFLTNTISDEIAPQQSFAFGRAIAAEGQQATRVKQSEPVMVVIGNPPYSNFGMLNRGGWIRGLLDDYKRGLNEKKLNLDDDYIKFIRFGQWRIERSGSGILAFITNNSYIDGITHRQMRRSLMNSFTDIYILDLHGSSKKQERSPDGAPDENVFDIQQGVAISIFVKEPSKVGPAQVHYVELWGQRESKYKYLSEFDVISSHWERLCPEKDLFFFRPKDMSEYSAYSSFFQLKNIFPHSGSGVKTERDKLTIHWSQADAENIVESFKKLPETMLRERYSLDSDSRDWTVIGAKNDVLSHNNIDYFRSILYRPFDYRRTWYSGQSRGFIGTPGYPTMRHMLYGKNLALLTCRQQADLGFYHVLCSDAITECCAVSLKTREITSVFPLYLYPAPEGSTRRQTSMLEASADATGPGGRRPNLSPAFIAELEQRLGLHFIPDGSGDLEATVGPEDVFHYAYAIFHSPTYRSRYAEFLKIDFPRLPLTSDRTLFAALAQRGAELVDLHLLRLPGQGGVGGRGGAAILQAPGRQGVTFPQRGTNQVDRVAYLAPTGDHTGRVRINDQQYFEGVHPDAWAMQIGGYQPLEKWLKDRRGRTLSADDVSHYLRMIIALRETRRVMAEIDTIIPGWPLP